MKNLDLLMISEFVKKIEEFSQQLESDISSQQINLKLQENFLKSFVETSLARLYNHSSSSDQDLSSATFASKLVLDEVAKFANERCNIHQQIGRLSASKEILEYMKTSLESKLREIEQDEAEQNAKERTRSRLEQGEDLSPENREQGIRPEKQKHVREASIEDKEL